MEKNEMRKKKSLKNKIDKEVLERMGIIKHTVKLQCSVCKNKKVVTVNKPEIYTEEVRNNYICLNCRDNK